MPSTSKLNLAKLLSLSLILTATSGCVTDLTAPAHLNNYCAIAKPISYDMAKDTPETVLEIEAHNSKFVCVCEADCPKGVK